MNLISLMLTFFFFISNDASAQTYCEQFTSAQLKEKYNANFLNKDLRGCFSDYFSQGLDNKTGAVGSFSIIIGKQNNSLNEATSAKIAYAAFAGITSYQQTNRQLGDNADAALQSIREQSKNSAQFITSEIAKLSDTYKAEALPAIQENAQQIRSESVEFTKTVRSLNDQVNKIASASSKEYDLPGKVDVSEKSDPVLNEKLKWDGSKNSSNVPFHVLRKIQKTNPHLSQKILEEIKYARYIDNKLMKPMELPLLNELQALDSKNKKFIFKYSNAKRNLSTDDTYYEQKKFVLHASYELKKIADQNTTEGNFQRAEESYDMATLALEITTSLPVAATGRGLYEFFSGKSLLTNRQLSNFERGASLSIALIDLMPQAWIARGVRGTWLVGELGARLVEKGVIKVGFENALNVGIENARLFSSTLSELVTNQLIKIETAKKIVEHRLFFNFLSQEKYLISRQFEKNALELDKILVGLGAAAENQTIEQKIFQTNRIKYASDGALLRTAEDINSELSPFYPKPPFKIGDMVVENSVKETDEFVRFYQKGTTQPHGFFVARAKDVEGLTATELQQKYALPYKPDSMVLVKLPVGTTIYEGIAEKYICDSGEILQGGGWQTYIKVTSLDELRPAWFTETNIIFK